MKKLKSFTLVELIVVVAIIAVLSVISVVTVSERTTKSRDTRRMGDLTQSEKFIDLYYTKTALLPTPDNFVQVKDESGINTWKQGEFGDSVASTIGIKTVPEDPSGGKYEYSVGNDGKTYQLKAMLEGGSKVVLQEKAYAADKYSYIVGTYKGYLISTNGTNYYMWESPSMFLKKGEISLRSGGGVVMNKKKETESYTTQKVEVTNLFDNNKNNDQVVFQQIASTFTGNLGNIETSISVVQSIADSNLNIDKSVVLSGYVAPTASSIALKQIFASGTEYTSLWSSNTCDANNITVVEVSDPLYFASRKILSGNTVYSVKNGTYVITGNSATDYISFAGDCSAIVGESQNGVVFSGGFTVGGDSPRGIISASGRKNIIVANISVDGNKSASNRVVYGVFLTASSNNSTVSKVTAYNFRYYGVYIRSSTNNTVSGITAYGNNDGVYLISSTNNNISNIISYNNNNGVTFYNASNYNSGNNIIVYNNSTAGLYLDASTYNTINNLQIYNSAYGLYMYGSANNNVFNNVNSYNNNQGISLSTSSNNIFNNISTYNNFYGFYLASSNSNFMNNSSIYNNNTDGITSSTSSSNLYYGALKMFGNGTNTVPAGVAAGTAGSGIGGAIFANGTLDTSGTMSCSLHSQPNLVSSWGTNCVDKGQKSSGLTTPVTTYNYGTSVTKQVRPVKWNAGATALELYGTDGTNYSTSKFVGQR